MRAKPNFESMKEVYCSKVDWWLALLIFGITVGSIVPALMVEYSWPAVGLTAFVVAIEVVVLWGFRYVVEDDRLTVVSCFCIKERYALAGLKEIAATHCLLSSPAASLDRLELSFEGRSVIISPKRKAEFVAHLQRLNPTVKVTL